MDNKALPLQQRDSQLSAEMRQVCTTPKSNCLVGIPTMDPKGTRYKNWLCHHDRFCRFLGGIEYYSALVSRADCGAWMESQEYVDQVRKIWLGKSVAVVAQPDNLMLAAVRKTQDVTLIESPGCDAYSVIDDLERQALASGCDVVLLSCGPTATCLANRLSDRVQGVDLGSIGGLLLRWI